MILLNPYKVIIQQKCPPLKQKECQLANTQIAITVIDTIYHAIDVKLHWNYNPCYPDY